MKSLLRYLVCLAALSCLPAAASALPGRNVQVLANFNDYPPAPGGYGYASCWAYVHGDGREYAVIGCTNGTAIYNVTNPASSYFVGFIAGPSSLWREMKSYRNWIYVVTEANTAPNPGLQIIRMTDPEHPVLAGTYTTTFSTSHTVSVDTTRALLICNGTKFWTGPSTGNASGMRILSIANPEAPVEVSWWPGGSTPVPINQYVHDCVPIGNRIYAASVYAGRVRIIDLANPALPAETASWSYPSAFYTHNCWPDSSGNYLYVTDEQNGQTLRVFDISSLASPPVVSEYTSNSLAIVHNAHVKGHELYLANYTEGVRFLDIGDPAHPAEFGWADTYPGTSGGYSGVWGVCPYFPSGTVIASDMQTGLWVFRPNRDYGVLEIRVVDSVSGLPLPGIVVRLASQGDSLRTSSDGIVRFAPSPGSHTVEILQFGYDPISVPHVVAAGARDSIDLVINARPTATVSGTVKDAYTSAPLLDAEVILAYTPIDQHTDAGGAYTFGSVPEDLYEVEVRRPGYMPNFIQRSIGPGGDSEQSYHLVPAATWDDVEIDRGWSLSAPGDNALYGRWTRSIPAEPATATGGLSGFESAAAGGEPRPPIVIEHDGEPELPVAINPATDRTPPPGTRCFLTGIGSNANTRSGRTTLTSPALDATSMVDPTAGFWRWYWSNGDNDDYLATLISNNNGTTWVPVDTVRGMHNHWEEQTLRIGDYVTPTAQIRIRFVASEGGYASLVEAGIDDIILYDAASGPVAVGPGPTHERLAFASPWPNPSEREVRLTLTVPRAGAVEVEVLDLAGRRVRTLHRGRADAGTLSIRWNGADDSGRRVSAGLYYARARSADDVASVRFARVK